MLGSVGKSHVEFMEEVEGENKSIINLLMLNTCRELLVSHSFVSFNPPVLDRHSAL